MGTYMGCTLFNTLDIGTRPDLCACAAWACCSGSEDRPGPAQETFRQHPQSGEAPDLP